MMSIGIDHFIVKFKRVAIIKGKPLSNVNCLDCRDCVTITTMLDNIGTLLVISSQVTTSDHSNNNE